MRKGKGKKEKKTKQKNIMLRSRPSQSAVTLNKQLAWAMLGPLWDFFMNTVTAADVKQIISNFFV